MQKLRRAKEKGPPLAGQPFQLPCSYYLVVPVVEPPVAGAGIGAGVVVVEPPVEPVVPPLPTVPLVLPPMPVLLPVLPEPLLPVEARWSRRH